MTWWAWMILGAVLLGAELFAIDAQFYLVFLGLSAILVGIGGILGIVVLEWAQQYIDEFGNLAKSGNTLVVPANLADLASMIALATNVARGAPGGAP